MTYNCPTCGSQELSFDGPGWQCDYIESDNVPAICEDCGWTGVFEDALTVEAHRVYHVNRDYGDENDRLENNHTDHEEIYMDAQQEYRKENDEF